MLNLSWYMGKQLYYLPTILYIWSYHDKRNFLNVDFPTSGIGDWWGEEGHILISGFYVPFSALSDSPVLLVTTSKEMCDNYSFHVIFPNSLMSKQIRYTIFYVWNVSGSLFIRQSLYNSPSPPLIKYQISMQISKS